MKHSQTRARRSTTPLVVEVAPQETSPADDWSKYFASARGRQAIAALAANLNRRAASRLSATLPPDAFAALLLAYAPAVQRLIPYDIMSDSKFDTKHARALAVVAKLRSRDEQSAGWSDQNARALASCVVAAAAGVHAASLRYSGGWDETEPNESVSITFRPGVCEDAEDAMRRAQRLSDTLYIGHECNAYVRLSHLLLMFTNDSGSGPPVYSQNVEVNFSTGKCRLYGRHVEEPDDDDESDE